MPLKLHEDWAEAFFSGCIILGFMVAILLRSPALSYLAILLAAFQAGRVIYLKHLKEPIFPFVLIVVGFLVGYLIGAFWVSRLLTIILFAGMFWLSYYLHKKEFITTFKSELFIK